LETTITKDILKNELYEGPRPAVELLYTRYSGMLFGYILQFVPDRAEASDLLAEIFVSLAPRLQAAFDSSLSIYCWLQVEARKIILELTAKKRVEPGYPESFTSGTDRTYHPGTNRTYYLSLLEEASPEHQWVFRELFIYGRKKEELAALSGKDLAYISGILRDCLLIIRKNLD
jgi:DNA-directed RNA polymerase specialized sigma24 family protein